MKFDMKSVSMSLLASCTLGLCFGASVYAYGDSWEDDTPTVRYDDSVYRAMKASKLYKLALDGDVAAMRILGQKLITGNGVKKDVRNGVKWIRKAAEEESDPAAMYMLGQMYEKGKGVSKNERQAVEWYVNAYEEDYQKADAKIMQFSPSYALDWWKEQASSNKEAALKLIVCYATGADGVKADISEAKYYYNIASDKWPQEAKSTLASLPRDVQEQLTYKANTRSYESSPSSYTTSYSSQDVTEALAAAIEAGEYEQVKSLLQSGGDAKAKHQGIPLLYLGAKAPYDAERIVRALLNHGADVHATNVSGETALFPACMRFGQDLSERPDVVKMLIDVGADVNVKNNDGETPLMYSVCTCQPLISKMLLEAGADVNVSASGKDNLCNLGCQCVDQEFPETYNPLIIACCKKSYDSIRLLLEHGANANETYKGTPILFHFVKTPGAFQLFLDHGYDINLQDDVGDTLLGLAATHPDEMELVTKCLEAGADPNIKNAEGNTPLMVAVVTANQQLVNRLLKCKIDINATNNGGLSALHFACENFTILKLLIEKGGVDINRAGGTVQMTVLHKAAQYGNLEVVKYLVEKGADISLPDSQERTAEQIAKEYKHADVANYLSKLAWDKSMAESKAKQESAQFQYAHVLWGCVALGFLLLIIILAIARSRSKVIVMKSSFDKNSVSVVHKKHISSNPQEPTHKTTSLKPHAHLPLHTPSLASAAPVHARRAAGHPVNKKYMLIMPDGRQVGPCTMDELKAYLSGGAITVESLVWCEGMADWAPLNSILRG